MMTIKNGKFFKDGVQVPIEHGNKEQIKILNKIREMSEDGFTPDIRVRKIISMGFRCICGSGNDFDDFTVMDEDDIPENIIVGEKDTCNNCGIEYKVIYDGESDWIMLKMIPKKV